MDKKEYIEDLKDFLKKNGFKLTHQRRNIVEILLEKSSEHMNTEEIYNVVKKRCPEIGLATCYRTIQILDKLGYLNKLNLDDGSIRYQINLDISSHNHHHLVCNECGRIIEVEEDMLDNIECSIQNKYDFKITNHDLKFHGICSECNKKKNNNEKEGVYS